MQLKINSNRTYNLKDKNIKKQAESMEYYNTRVSKTLLDYGITEILFTNISSEEANMQKLKELYSRKWEIELIYRKIKNKLRKKIFQIKRGCKFL